MCQRTLFKIIWFMIWAVGRVISCTFSTIRICALTISCYKFKYSWTWRKQKKLRSRIIRYFFFIYDYMKGITNRYPLLFYSWLLFYYFSPNPAIAVFGIYNSFTWHNFWLSHKIIITKISTWSCFISIYF